MIDHEGLRRLRKKKFKTLGLAAAACDMNAAHLGEIERGERVPKLDTLLGMLVAYGYNLELYAVKEQGKDRLSHRLL